MVAKASQIREVILCTGDHVYKDTEGKEIAHKFIPVAGETPLEDIQWFSDLDTELEASKKLISNLSLAEEGIKEATDKLRSFSEHRNKTYGEYARRWAPENNAGGTGDHKVAI